RVFKQNEDTFRFTANGEVSYSGNGLKKFFISNSGTAVTQAEVIEAAHQMIKQTVGPLYGNSSSFYLEKLEQTEKNKYHLTFGCQVEGVPVFFSNGTHAVEIQISGTNISAFKVQLRQYNLSGDTRTLVPERQAMKALSSQEGQLRSLFVGYVDDGSGTVTPEWLARQ
ncbi:MAG: hypothetical protein IIY71_05025, partial [Oscillospiraceae bacterium]|nr:hypothetical protein [Oscillospiraceae bacterium]